MRALSMAPGVAAHVPVASTPAPPGHATRFIVSAAVDLPVASSARRHSDGITLCNFFGLNVQIQADLLHGQQRPQRGLRLLRATPTRPSPPSSSSLPPVRRVVDGAPVAPGHH